MSPIIWTPERIEEFRRLYLDERLSFKRCAQLLDTTPDALMSMAGRNGIKRPKKVAPRPLILPEAWREEPLEYRKDPRCWLDSELEILKRACDEGWFIERVLVELPQRTECAVLNRLRNHGWSGIRWKASEHDPRTRPIWTEERVAELTRLIEAECSYDEAAKEFGCTRNAIAGACKRFGLQKKDLVDA